MRHRATSNAYVYIDLRGVADRGIAQSTLHIIQINNNIIVMLLSLFLLARSYAVVPMEWYCLAQTCHALLQAPIAHQGSWSGAIREENGCCISTGKVRIRCPCVCCFHQLHQVISLLVFCKEAESWRSQSPREMRSILVPTAVKCRYCWMLQQRNT